MESSHDGGFIASGSGMNSRSTHPAGFTSFTLTIYSSSSQSAGLRALGSGILSAGGDREARLERRLVDRLAVDLDRVGVVLADLERVRVREVVLDAVYRAERRVRLPGVLEDDVRAAERRPADVGAEHYGVRGLVREARHVGVGVEELQVVAAAVGEVREADRVLHDQILIARVEAVREVAVQKIVPLLVHRLHPPLYVLVPEEVARGHADAPQLEPLADVRRPLPARVPPGLEPLLQIHGAPRERGCQGEKSHRSYLTKLGILITFLLKVERSCFM
jgi:hypothetical protein